MAGQGTLKTRLLARLYASRLYDIWLNGPVPKGLDVAPAEPWPGDPAAADRLFHGRWRLGGEEIVTRDLPWTGTQGGPAWTEALHDFEWLRHFTANGGDTARRHARALVAGWLGHFPRWQALTWRPDILGRRLIAWFHAWSFLVEGSETTFTRSFHAALLRQARHLSNAIDQAPAGASRIDATVAFVYSCLCLDDRAGLMPRAVARLEAEIARQILPDGGHVSRCPTTLLGVLARLVGLKAALIGANQTPPRGVIEAIDRIAPALRMLRHGDGAFGLFQGGIEGDTRLADAVLSRAEAHGKPLAEAPYSGFERATAKKGLLLVDVGPPPDPATTGGRPHAGLLACEFSSGKDRLLVNCGETLRTDGVWAGALAATAAHTTLVLDDHHALDIAKPETWPERPRVERQETEGAIWIAAEHDGYRSRYGLKHRRRLFLNHDGDDLRGEDSLIGNAMAGAADRDVNLRFHLHPSVSASLTQGGEEVLLRTPSGEGWRFRASGRHLGLDDSIYFGDGIEARRTLQILVSDRIGPEGAVVKWALTRLRQDGAD